MILVTGGSGFIGSNFIKYLNSLGRTDIIIADYISNGKQYKNLLDLKFVDLVAPEQALELIWDRTVKETVYHFGAVSDTTCWDGEKLLQRNYHFTKDLIELCCSYSVNLSYASSASVYGLNDNVPLNLYAYSKKLVDDYVVKHLSERKCVDHKLQGFRYFNVYGPNEDHKGNQASPYSKFRIQADETGIIQVFEGSENFHRDFVPVEMVCEIQQFMLEQGESGIFDLGTGKPKSFMDVAVEIALEEYARVEVIPFPDHLRGHYQTYTKADMRYLAKYNEFNFTR